MEGQAVSMAYRKRQGGDVTRYGNTRTGCSLGHSHRSKLESALCQQLTLLVRAKELRDLEAEVTVYLSDARIKYIPDFRAIEVATGCPRYFEAKGFENDRWPILKKLWAAYGPAPLEVWKGTPTRLRLDEIITPEVKP